MTNLIARQRPSTLAALVATFWSFVLMLVIAPFANSLTNGDSMRLLIALVVPVSICLVALAISSRKGVGWSAALWCCALLMCLFSFVTGFSIGLLYVPAVLTLGYAAVRHSAET